MSTRFVLIVVSVATLLGTSTTARAAVPHYDTTCLNSQVPLLQGDHPYIIAGFTSVGITAPDTSVIANNSFFDGAGDLWSSPAWTIAGRTVCGQAEDVNWLWGYSFYDNTPQEEGTVTMTLTAWSRVTHFQDGNCNFVSNPTSFTVNFGPTSPAASVWEESSSVAFSNDLFLTACEDYEFAQFKVKSHVEVSVPGAALRTDDDEGCFYVELALLGCPINNVCL